MFYLRTLQGFQAAFTQFENKHQELGEARRSGVAWRAGRTWHIRRGVTLLCERFHLFPGVCFQMLCDVRVKTFGETKSFSISRESTFKE